MKKKLIWRLKEQPTSESLQGLVNHGILTKEEAREILFSSETEEDRDKKGLESEIKFLRELVEKLSKSRSEIVTTIREVQVPYRRWGWYYPYNVWCGNEYTTDGGSGTLTCDTSYGTMATSNFSDIKTF